MADKNTDLNLLDFQRPARYLGKEWNLDTKHYSRSKLKICLCFPQMYEIGMSSLGFLIVYHLLNSLPEVSCERCFLPGEDLEKYLFKEKKPLFSLETKTPLKDFDITAFSINYELNFINFLKMLYLGGIPLKSKERDTPLVFIGGLNNPEPLSDFTDIFFLGEFEEQAEKIVKTLIKSKGLSKKDTLLSLSGIEGIYLPGLYYNDNHTLKPAGKESPQRPKRAYVKDLNRSFYPDKWIVPYIPIVFDRAQVEIQRGCPNTCKFCQARSIYYPYREKKKAKIITSIKQLFDSTGYETISLTGLSVIDYSKLKELITEILPYLRKKKIGISIPSLKPSMKAIEILELLNFNGKPGITLALETANDRLRESLGKNISLSDCYQTAKAAAKLNYTHFKMYFMAGLPNETEEDILGIGDIVENMAYHYKKEKGHNPKINTTVSCFIPKPFSEFQEHRLISLESFSKKRSLLRGRISRNKNIKINFSNYSKSYLETVLSRSDRTIAPLIERIFNKTLLSDLDWINPDIWQKEAEELGLDLDIYTQTSRTLPKHIEMAAPFGRRKR